MSTQNTFEAAFELQVAGALTEAETVYRHILARSPFHIDALHHLGILLHQKGDTEAGITLILNALDRDNSSPYRCNDFGNILTQKGDLVNAAAAFKMSLALNSEDATVWNNLGSVLHRQQDLVAAENAYRSALALEACFVPALNNLAALLAEKGCAEESSWYECLAYIQPPLTGKSPIRLGSAYYRLNRLEEAAAHYRAWLEAEPDNAFARHHLAACTGVAIPSQASDAYLKTVFDSTAAHFETNLVDQLHYQGPEIIATLLDRVIPQHRQLQILDGGCGTGLCAPVLKPYANHLTGVDLSSGMLAQAASKALYDSLVEMELTTYLLNTQQRYDLISVADTLVYFGDLSLFFKAATLALNPNGLLAFTVELAETTVAALDFILSSSGRYAHRLDYLIQLLETQRFNIIAIDEVVIRMEIGQPIAGLGILAQALPS